MDTISHHTDNFSLSEGGPIHNMMAKAHLHNKQRPIAIAAFCITWLPLFIITAIEGTLYSGTQLPFLKDIAMQARVLIALQMLILIRVTIDTSVAAVIKYISEALMDTEERKNLLSNLLDRARKLTNSGITEIIILLLVIVATTSLLKAGFYSSMEGSDSWMTFTGVGKRTLSKAGYWAVFISIPIFQFLFARWLWRYFVWVLLLFRLSKCRLNLLPTHADRAGGLGIIMLAQRTFNLLFVTGSVILSGQFIVTLNHNPDHFSMIRNEAIGYVIISVAFILFPLLFFAVKLGRVKDNGLQQLSALGVTLSSKFEREWINKSPIENRIEDNSVDPSMLFDYAGMYDLLQQLRILPVTLRDVTGMALLLFLPFIPILFVHFSVGELLQKIVGMLA